VKAGAKVRLTKLQGDVPPKHHDGELDDPINLGYTIDGVLLGDVEVGQPVCCARMSRNGLVIPGVFSSSPIKKIQGAHLHTRNSIWHIERLP
jgi:hypothetical protein